MHIKAITLQYILKDTSNWVHDDMMDSINIPDMLFMLLTQRQIADLTQGSDSNVAHFQRI